MSASNEEYSESEADAILKRAIDLQVSLDGSKQKKELGHGVTLDQLYRSAAEIGIEQTLVRKAADEIMGRKPTSIKADPKAPSVIERDFLSPITEADFPALLEHLRAVSKSSGAAQVIGGTLEWTSMIMANREMIHVVVIPSTDSTKVRIRSTNPFAQIPIRAPFFFLPIIILLGGFIPMLSFGGRYFAWTGLLPFALIAALACLISAMFFGRFSRLRAGATSGNQLMESIGEWLRTRACG